MTLYIIEVIYIWASRDRCKLILRLARLADRQIGSLPFLRHECKEIASRGLEYLWGWETSE